MNSLLTTGSSVSRVLNMNELLSLIFTFCLPSDPREVERDPEDWSLEVNSQAEFQYPSISEQEAPLSLAHVSRLWRSEALATPGLWTCLHIHMDRPYWLEGIYARRMLNALLFWLKHSRSLPLSVRISRDMDNGRRASDSDTVDVDSIFLTAMVDALFKHTKRWENISIDLPETAISPFYHPSNYEFPCLKTFELKHALSDYPLRIRNIFHRSASDLRSLAISGVLPTELPANVRFLGYANMTMCVNSQPRGTLVEELVLCDVKVSNRAVIRFSGAFPLLKKLVLSHVIRMRRPVANEDVVGIDEPEQCFLDNLISLSIRSKGSYFPLNLVTAPVLEELKTVAKPASMNSTSMDDHSNIIIEFLHRSQAPLQKFSYSTGGDEATNKGLKSILQAMPALRELSVELPKLCHSDLVMLQDPSICPRLADIHSFGQIIVMDSYHRLCDDKDEPRYTDIVDLIRVRCRSREPVDCDVEQVKEDASAYAWDQAWVKRLELPLHKEDERNLRKSEIFRMADVEFVNTHKCSGNMWCGRRNRKIRGLEVRYHEGRPH